MVMGSILSSLARVLFGISLVTSLLVAASVCKLLLHLPISRDTREKCALYVTHVVWKMVFLSCPWIRTTKGGRTDEHLAALINNMDDVEAKAEGRAPRPVFILNNHTSFLDTLLGFCELPAHMAVRTRTYMGAHLFKLPLLATICRAVGHFPVYFSGSKYGDFSVDKDKMALVEKDVDRHLSSGGILCFFPEGQVNKSPATLCPFRYGGFKKALQYDARIYAMATVGHEICWPPAMQLGGLPAHTEYELKALAPSGSHAMVRELRRSLPKAQTEGKEDHALLADWARDQMQEMRDGLVGKAN